MEIEKVMMARTKIKLVIPEQYRIPEDDEWYGPLDDGVWEVRWKPGWRKQKKFRQRPG